MRLYLDTEYNGFGGELISIALVSGSGGLTFYEVLDYSGLKLDPWVEQNVIPALRGRGGRPKDEVRREFCDFLRWYDDCEVVADWAEDFVHFFGLYRGKDFASSFDWSIRTRLLSGPSGAKSWLPHNALADAEALRDWCELNPEVLA